MAGLIHSYVSERYIGSRDAITTSDRDCTETQRLEEPRSNVCCRMRAISSLPRNTMVKSDYECIWRPFQTLRLVPRTSSRMASGRR